MHILTTGLLTSVPFYDQHMMRLRLQQWRCQLCAMRVAQTWGLQALCWYRLRTQQRQLGWWVTIRRQCRFEAEETVLTPLTSPLIPIHNLSLLQEQYAILLFASAWWERRLCESALHRQHGHRHGSQGMGVSSKEMSIPLFWLFL